MRRRKGLRLAGGLVLCVVGFVLAKATPYRERTFVIGTNGCRLVTDVLDDGNDQVGGFVVLLHGLSANKKIMSYLARAFAAQNLRVFVPDLPGHGRTEGPFSFSRAESCTQSFVRELVQRRAIDATRTILAGHSMGGAIAVRLAAHVPVAGDIAISPAPMSTRHGIGGYLLPYENSPPAPPNTLVISGAWEPASVRETAHELIEGGAKAETDKHVVLQTEKYVVVRRATHVSLLFDPAVARTSQEWVAKLLGLPPNAPLPSRLPLAGGFLGFAGILLLAGPFIRETVASPRPDGEQESRAAQINSVNISAAVSRALLSSLRAEMEMAVACLAIVGLLYVWQPLSFIRLFDGGYFASFLLIAGLLLLALHYKSVPALLSNVRAKSLLGPAVAGLLLFFLISAWFDVTLTETWMTWFRWLRFPAFLVAALVYVTAEEVLLTTFPARPAPVRTVMALTLRAVGWITIAFAIFILHRGPILLFLLVPYFGVLSILQLTATQIVRTETRSLAAAALFGAILLAGFCLVIFPVT